MKRILCGIVVSAIAFCGIITASAQTDTITSVPGKSEKQVTAIYVAAADEHLASAPIENGKATVITKDGTEFTFTIPDGVLPAGTTAFVRQIPDSEKDAYNWIMGTVSGFGSSAYPFYIYFENNGERVEPKGTYTINIKSLASLKNPAIYSVSTDGKATLIDSELKNQSITLEVDKSGYVVLVDKEESGGGEGGGGKGEGSPKTGDSTKILLLMPAAMLFVLISRRRKATSK